MSGARPPTGAIAELIYEAFERYEENFRRITRRARSRFVDSDWRGARRDLAERIELYDKVVRRTAVAACRQAGGERPDRALWHAVRATYQAHVEGINDAQHRLTFFNSVSRRVFDTVGVDRELEFVGDDLPPATAYARAPARETYLVWGQLERAVRALLASRDPGLPWADLEQATSRVTDALRAAAGGRTVLRIELLSPVFYQSTRAYLVGRVEGQGWQAPLAIAIANDAGRLAVDTTLTDEDAVSVLFGFTRSYFFADLDCVAGAVAWLKGILPRKPVDELYTVLGRARQGKTERYRLLTEHLRVSDDRFCHAPGAPGLVMICFTLPSYDLVFKVIRDRFGHPKTTTHAEVVARYDLVFKHDRAGRLIDTQSFRHFELPLARFDERLAEELLREAAAGTRVVGEQLVFDQIYVERRVEPLNLFLERATPEAARAAVLDYGQAIRDLACTNIFPGDLLIKNFGVTRHGRVVFYDYDELRLLTECRFRELPEGDADDELRAEPWFFVGEDDVFPEQFGRFLAFPRPLREAFLAAHGELLDPTWWRRLQAAHRSESVPEVLPYDAAGARAAAR